MIIPMITPMMQESRFAFPCSVHPGAWDGDWDDEPAKLRTDIFHLLMRREPAHLRALRSSLETRDESGQAGATKTRTDTARDATPVRRMWCIFGRRLGRPEGKSGTGGRDITRRVCYAIALAAGSRFCHLRDWRTTTGLR